MSDPVYATEPEFPTSCWKEDAVDVLVGDAFEEDTQGNVADLSLDEQDFLYNPEVSWDRTVEQLRETISQGLSKAVAADRPTEAFQRKLNALARYEEAKEKRHLYLIDIDDELTKGDSSALRIDQRATEKAGVVHITLKSLDQWTRNQYGISILDRSPLNPVTENCPELQERQQKNGSAPKDGLSRTQKENLYTTFAVLIEAFIEMAKNPRYGKADRLNVQNIAEHLASLATKASNPDSLRGQSAEAIKGRIEEAMRIRRSKLPGTAK